MSGALLMSLLGGLVVGGIGVWLWRARIEQALRIELEVLRTRVKDDAEKAREREQFAAQSRTEMQAVFGELARSSLRSNSEVFLQLARTNHEHGVCRWHHRRDYRNDGSAHAVAQRVA